MIDMRWLSMRRARAQSSRAALAPFPQIAMVRLFMERKPLGDDTFRTRLRFRTPSASLWFAAERGGPEIRPAKFREVPRHDAAGI